MTIIDYYDELAEASINFVKTELAERFPQPVKQISKGDSSIAGKGFPSFLMFFPGAMPITTEGPDAEGERTINVSVEILLDAWSRWEGSEAKSWTQFSEYRADMFHVFNIKRSGRTLGRAPRVRRASLNIQERPRYIPLNAGVKDSVPAFIAQVMTLTAVIVINKE